MKPTAEDFRVGDIFLARHKINLWNVAPEVEFSTRIKNNEIKGYTTYDAGQYFTLVHVQLLEPAGTMQFLRMRLVTPDGTTRMCQDDIHTMNSNFRNISYETRCHNTRL